jgi:hypothetical protein
MLAPAEKNFSPWPVRTMTCTLSSKRALRTASSMSRIISCVYVLGPVAPGLRGAPAASEASSMTAMPFGVVA